MDAQRNGVVVDPLAVVVPAGGGPGVVTAAVGDPLYPQGSALVVTTSSSPVPPIAPGAAPPPLVVTHSSPLHHPTFAVTAVYAV